MERKIGEIFEDRGCWYQCIRDITCINCGFNNKGCLADKHITGDCSGGEPYEHYEKFYQCYKLPMETEIRLLPNNCYPIGKDNLVEIEIKQKEDMEEKKVKADEIMDKYYHNVITYQQFEKEIQALYADKEEIKPTLKPFDLEAAKAGKSVCTRDGRKARIICFDRKDVRPIIALIKSDNDDEGVYYYYADGLNLDSYPSVFDLMMLPEKKEGWAIIRRSDIYETEEQAKNVLLDSRIGVMIRKIEWEE